MTWAAPREEKGPSLLILEEARSDELDFNIKPQWHSDLHWYESNPFLTRWLCHSLVNRAERKISYILLVIYVWLILFYFF